MAITTMRCPVLDVRVTVVRDIEGNVTKIVCPEYDEATGQCRWKKAALRGGPLSQLLERVSEDALDTHGTACVLRAA